MLEQGLRFGAGWGVRVAELPGTGSRSAVFLIHSEVSGSAGRNREGFPPGASSKTGCYHTRSMNVL